jgi:hypothetical protein
MFAFLQPSPPMARDAQVIDPRSREAIARRLTVMRLGLGHTQGFMSSQLGSSPEGKLWENYERGRRQPWRNLHKIAQTFGFNILWILEGRVDHLTADQLRTVQLGEFRLANLESKPGKKGKKSKRRPPTE